MAKGDDIFIYFLDYRYYEHYKKITKSAVYDHTSA